MRFLDFRSAQTLVCAGVVAALAAIGFASWDSLRDEYRMQTSEIFAAGDRTAQQLAMRTAEVFDRVNQSTLLVKFMRSGPASSSSLPSLGNAGVIATGLTQAIYVADARGFVQDTTSSATALFVADEEFFKRHRRADGPEIDVSPVWTDPLTKKPSVPVTRRLADHDDGFDGIVAAMVDPAALSVPYARHEEKGTVIGVLGADGIYRSRAVDGQLSFGARVDVEGMARRAAASRRTGTPATSLVDGVKRFATIVKVDRYPMYAVVAVSADEALAGYREKRARVVGWALMAALGALIAGGLLLRFARRLDASRERTRKAEAAFRATLDGSLDAVFILEARRHARSGKLQDFTIADCNDKAAEALGRTRRELLGRLFGDLLPCARTVFLKHFERALVTRKPVHAEMLAIEPPIAGRWLHHQLVPLDDGVALITRDISDRKRAEAALEALACVDGLTTLLNRRGFEQRLAEAMARAARSKEPLALVYLDLDGFKKINDSLGHAAGDAVLVEVARRLKAMVRATDSVSRLGGDEFAIVLEGAGTRQDMSELCKRIVAGLQASHVFEGKSVVATPSLGIAVLQRSEHAQALVQRADAAMYQAKLAGKARMVWSESQEQTTASTAA